MNDFISRKRERRTPQFSARAPKAPRGEISRACALVVDTSDSHAAGGLVDLGRPFGPRTVPSFCGVALRGGSLPLHRCVEQVEQAGDGGLFARQLFRASWSSTSTPVLATRTAWSWRSLCVISLYRRAMLYSVADASALSTSFSACRGRCLPWVKTGWVWESTWPVPHVVALCPPRGRGRYTRPPDWCKLWMM